MIRLCPNLVGKKDYKSITINYGGVVVPITYPCMLENCKKYNTKVHYDEKEDKKGE